MALFYQKCGWNVETAMEKIVEWTVAYMAGGDINACMVRQIKCFYEN